MTLKRGTFIHVQFNQVKVVRTVKRAGVYRDLRRYTVKRAGRTVI